VLDRGEREEWFDSALIVGLSVVAAVALVGFLLRELVAPEPILDLSVFRNRNFALGTAFMAMAGVGFYSSMLLLALFTQKILDYDAWTAGFVLAPAGVGNLISLAVAGRLVTRVDQRAMLALGFFLTGGSAWLMSNLTLDIDYWTLVWPRFIQGVGQGFIFVPLTTLALATIPRARLNNATAAFNMIRNVGGGVGVALSTTFLSRWSQYHQSRLVSHVDVWSGETAGRLRQWSEYFVAQGADPVTAQQRAVGLLYRDTVVQARILAYADEFWILGVLLLATLVLIPFMARVRADAPEPAAAAETAA
jgi:DHA2 family multidrug resistance protein